jgi:hypothetical protein
MPRSVRGVALFRYELWPPSIFVLCALLSTHTHTYNPIQPHILQVLKQMREGIKGGFDEERFGARIGFANLKK